MNRTDIIEFLGEDWTRTMAMMRASLHTDVTLLNAVNENILGNAGKMLRPMLSLLMAHAIGGCVSSDTVRYAAATELLHNATLLHDDVADESSERRGKPTIAALMGPTSAVLIGDFWLSRAVDTVMSADSYERVIPLFSKTLSDLAEGEMIQLQKAGSADTSEEDYFRIISCKTASLFVAACASAAVSVGATDEQYQAARDFAEALGIAFQIKDDILDYAGTDKLGKPVGIDLKEQKITLPLLEVLSGSPMEREIREKVMNIHEKPEYCDEIRSFVKDGGGVDLAAKRLDEYIGKAVEALAVFPDSRAKELLAAIAQYNVFRQV